MLRLGIVLFAPNLRTKSETPVNGNSAAESSATVRRAYFARREKVAHSPTTFQAHVVS